MALPVLYPHGEKDDEYYVDGGYADNIPIAPLYEQGFRKFIVIYLDKFKGRDRVKRIKLEYEQFPDAEIARIFPGKEFDFSFTRSCSINKKKIEDNLKLGYLDAMAQL